MFHRRSRSRSRSRGRDGGGGGGKQKGVACRWNDRGFGFIKPSDGSEDVFCHVSSIKDGNMLREGDEVEFESVYDDRKGKYRADNVTGGCQEEAGGKGGDGGYGGGGGYGDDGDHHRLEPYGDPDGDGDLDASQGWLGHGVGASGGGGGGGCEGSGRLSHHCLGTSDLLQGRPALPAPVLAMTSPARPRPTSPVAQQESCQLAVRSP